MNTTTPRFTDGHVTDGPDIVAWEQFWSKLEREFRHVCRELDADPATIDPDTFSDGLDRLALTQAQALITA